MTPAQLQRARKRDGQGWPLGEIAAELGLSFEQVALALYGGVTNWRPPAEPVPIELTPAGQAYAESQPATVEHTDDTKNVDDDGGEFGRDAAGRDAEPERSAAVAAGAAAAAGAGTTGASQEESPHSAAASPPPAAPRDEAEKPPRRYRLTNGAGEYLDKSGIGMTRKLDRAWSGTPQQMEAAFKVKPSLKELDPDRVLE